MGFEGFRGNRQAVALLQRAVSSRQPSHAYLFHGPKGIGKRALAGLFAQGLFCQGDGPPCGSCKACLKFEKGAHPDFSVVKKPGDKSFIVVEQIRALREEIYVRPNEADYRVVLLESCEDMNPSAANALLKVLEEPPPYGVFLLTAGNKGLLPETIDSRCVTVELFPVPQGEAMEWLAGRFPDAGEGLLAQACRYGGGNLGKSSAFLTDESIRQGWGQAMALASALVSRREYDILAALAPLDGDKEGFSRLLADFDSILGRIARAVYQGGDPEAEAFSGKITPLRAAALHNVIDGIRKALAFHGNLSLAEALFGAELKKGMELPM